MSGFLPHATRGIMLAQDDALCQTYYILKICQAVKCVDLFDYLISATLYHYLLKLLEILSVLKREVPSISINAEKARRFAGVV